MAYTVNEYRIQVRGNVGASEMWVNTWSFLDVATGQDVQDVGTILADLYQDITTFASWLSDQYTVVGATAKNLNTGALTELTGFSFTGSSAQDLLPTQLAMRVSLSGGVVRGGPFLTGFVDTAVSHGGLINSSCITDFLGALNSFGGALTTADWQLRIDRPTTTQTVPALVGRLGHRFDVIRRRGNDTAEAYSSWSPS